MKQTAPAEREPTLAEILVEPIVVRLMRRDGVAAADIVGLARAYRRRSSGPEEAGALGARLNENAAASW